MAEDEKNGLADSITGFVGLLIVVLILRWLWSSPFMSENDGNMMRVFKILGIFWLVGWILFMLFR